MATILKGPRTWSMTRNREGHREYRIKHRVHGTIGDGPFAALSTPGLPLPGSVWSFFSDLDVWAWCRSDATVTPVQPKEGEKHREWDVEQVFSSENKRCSEEVIENPLLQPPVISGGFTKYTEEATHNYLGLQIVNSAHEQIRGPQIEFDRNRPNIKIEQNVINSYQAAVLPAFLMDKVNNAPLWGLPRRCIKLSNSSFERKFMGSCLVYYTRTLEFDINFQTFDRSVLDEGTKVLKGHWDETTGLWTLDDIAPGIPPLRTNPTHFVRYRDQHDEPARVILNGYGLPHDPGQQPPPTSFLDDGSVVSINRQPPLVDTTGLGTEPSGILLDLQVDGSLEIGRDVTYVVTATTGTPATVVLETLPSVQVTTTPTGQQFDGFFSALFSTPRRKINVTWDTLASATGYRVYRRVTGVDTAFRLVAELGLAGVQQPGSIFVAKYEEADFLQLGIPTNF